MTPSIRKIRQSLQCAIDAIDRSERCESFFSSFNDNSSKQIIATGQVAAGKAIASVVDTIVEAADSGDIHILTRQDARNGNKQHSFIIAPTIPTGIGKTYFDESYPNNSL